MIRHAKVTAVAVTMGAVSIASPASAQDQPFDAVKFRGGQDCSLLIGGQLTPYDCLVITSRANDLTITNLTVNRGNCPLPDPTQFGAPPLLPTTLQFGERFKIMTCNFIEITVTTNAGEFTNTWQQ